MKEGFHEGWGMFFLVSWHGLGYVMHCRRLGWIMHGRGRGYVDSCVRMCRLRRDQCLSVRDTGACVRFV